MIVIPDARGGHLWSVDEILDMEYFHIFLENEHISMTLVERTKNKNKKRIVMAPAGVYSTMEKATEAVIKHKENTINEAAENGLVTSEIEELKAELNRCVEITETNLDE